MLCSEREGLRTPVFAAQVTARFIVCFKRVYDGKLECLAMVSGSGATIMVVLCLGEMKLHVLLDGL